MEEAVKVTLSQLVPLPWFDITVWLTVGAILTIIKPTRLFGIPILLLSGGGLVLSVAIVLFREASKIMGIGLPIVVMLISSMALISVAKEKAKFFLIVAAAITVVTLFFGIPIAYGG